jgi:N-acetyl-gamma-glutamyl-phosphate reductase
MNKYSPTVGSGISVAEAGISPEGGSTVQTAVVGATGFAGQELVALLARHPGTAIASAMSSTAESAARPLPRLARVWNGAVEPLDRDRLTAADVVFLALPENASADLAPWLVAQGRRVIDLSGSFRLRDDSARREWYPASPALPPGTAYGLTEFFRDEIRTASLVANPGCYPTAALLSLLPLAQAGLIDREAGVIIDAKSGISGAGRAATDRTHFSENHGSAAAYGVFKHRHVAEMEQELGAAITFVPHLVPLDRGILETIYVRVAPGTTGAAIDDAFTAAFAGEPFVRLTADALPEIKHVAWTNFCDVGWRFDAATRRLVIVACLDNLVKGAAGQALQNMNVMCGFDERTGLL